MEITVEALDQLAQEIVDLRKDYDDKKGIASEAYKKLDQKENELIEQMKKADKKQWRTEAGLFSLRETFSVGVPKTLEAKQALFDYIQEKYGLEVAMDKFSMHSKTLNSFYNQELEASGDPSLFNLPGVDVPTSTTSVSFRKA
jgi:hypothetical protein